MTTSAPTYRSRQTGPNSWTIYDVPVFSAHERKSASGKLHQFDKGWLEGALAKAKTRHAEGYFHPVHTRHHAAVDPSKRDDSDVAAAGRLQFRRVGQLRVGGREVPTIFADLVDVPGEVYREIQAGKLPYRSVEVLSPSSGEIDSLALMDHEVPFFRYPLLRVAEQTGAAEVETHTPVAASAALAYRSVGDAHAALFRYAATEAAMDTEQTTDEPQASMDANPLAKLAAALETALAMVKELAGEGEEGEEGDPNAVAPAPNPAPPAGPVESRAYVAGGTSPLRVAAPRAGSLSFNGATTEAVPATAAAGAALEGQLAAYRLRLDALEKKAADAEKSARIQKRAGELRERGLTGEQVAAFVKHSEKSEEAGLAFAAALESYGPAAPPSTWAGELPAAAVDPAEVMAYSAQGPNALSKARELHASWKRVKSEVPLADFLQINMGAE